MKILQYLLILCLSLLLFACSEKKQYPKDYDFFDEKNQDFFSKFMREDDRRFLNSLENELGEKRRREFEQQDLARKGSRTGYRGNNKIFSLSFNNERIKKILGIDREEPIVFLLLINRIDPKDHKDNPFNHFNGKDDFLALYKQNETTSNKLLYKLSDYKACEDNRQIQGFFCLRDKWGNPYFYHYFPNESEKIPYVDQSMYFYCEGLLDGQKSCRIRSRLDSPYNMDISIDFDNPNDFFDIIHYTEQYIYQNTGKHVWQNSPKQN